MVAEQLARFVVFAVFWRASLGSGLVWETITNDAFEAHEVVADQ
jgi:hypothetical protein